MLLTLLSLGISPSLAFAPTEWGDPAAPARLYPYHAGTQQRIRHSDAWQSFIQGEGQGWQARFDEKTGTAHRAWGPSIGLGSLPDSRAVDSALRALFARNPGLIGVDPATLKLSEAGYVAVTDTWYVNYTQYIEGLPIYKGGVSAQIRGERLMLLGIDTYPETPTSSGQEIDQNLAFDLAASQGPIGLNLRQDLEAEAIYLPLEKAGVLSLHRVWKVRSSAETPKGRFVGFVDAVSGELLAWYNEIRFLSGTLSGTHDLRTVDGNMATSPMPTENFYSGNNSYQTALDGTFNVADGSYSALLTGDYLTVNNDAGREGSLSFSSNNPTWTTASATQAEIDTYIFAHQVRDWSLQVAPEVGMATDALTAIVNSNQNCNAYYDGNINFFEAGQGCNNTGQIADVIYHEWGHGFHYYSVQNIYSIDGSVSEGVGDAVASFMTLDPTIAPYFMTNGAGIRDVSEDRVYPQDVVGEVHEDGLIFVGAVWDMTEEIEKTAGETPHTIQGNGWAESVNLFKNGIKANNTLETAFEDFLVADDDNNDLADGTPHICELITAFGLHGLGFGAQTGGGLVTIDHLSLGNQPAQTPIDFTGTTANIAPQCTGGSISEVRVRWSIDGRNYDSTPLSLQGDNFSGSIAGLPDGTIVSYYIEAVDGDGNTASWPPGGEIAPYTFYVGGLEEVWCANLDNDDGGFSHALLSGQDQEGADDWIYGAPNGLSDDPTEAYTGVSVWGNDKGGGQYNGAYQANIQNRLSSVAIDIGNDDHLILQYRRWLNVEDGVYDHARVYANEDVVWENHASSERIGNEQTQDVDWVLHTVDLSALTNPLTLGWEIESDGGLEFGGWNIDDICVYRPSASVIDTGTPDDTANPSNDDTATDDTAGDNVPGYKDDTDISLTPACGCASSPEISGLGGLALGLLALARRRKS